MFSGLDPSSLRIERKRYNVFGTRTRQVYELNVNVIMFSGLEPVKFMN